MKSIYLLLILFVFQLSPLLKAQNADAIVGEWLTSTGDAKLKIYKNNNQYQAQIYWLKEPISKIDGKPKRDRYNPDKNLQYRPIIGLHTLTELVYNPKVNEWTGKVYDPQKGRAADCFVVLKDSKTLILTGYIGLRSLSEKRTWLRVK